MTRVIWRGFMARKVRSLLTGIAIALGVALMVGTYVETDTINRSFAGIFSTANRNSAVVVTPHQALGRNQRVVVSPITDATLARVRAVPGVSKAVGGIFSTGALLTPSGKRISSGGAPNFITGVIPKPFENFDPVSGRYPVTASETAVDQSTASREHLNIGGTLIIGGVGPARSYRIVGIVKFAGSNSFGGASAALLTLPEAQRVVGEVGRYDQLSIAAAPGVTPAQLSARIRAILPANVDVRTGTQQANKQTSDIEANLSFLRTFLLVFAYVALFVGAFIIFNTFSITVAQRTRELGLLRTLGATGGQVMRSVIGESLLLGLTGSLIGLGVGIGLAPGLNALFKSFGADLPHNGTVLEARTVIVSLLVGTLITVAAAIAPALRATRVPPIAALREGVELPHGRLARYALPASIAVFALGVILIVAGLAGAGILAVGLGALVVFIGTAMLSPRFVPPLARAIGWPVRRRVTGQLARENAMRQPGRTAVTSAALMIGVALVAFVSILAAGFKASINNAVDRSFAGNLIVENSQLNSGSDQSIPATVAPTLRRVPGVAQVTPVAFTLGKVRGISGNASVTAIDPASFGSVYRIDWKHGSNATLEALGLTGAVATKNYADGNNLKVGSRIFVLTQSDQRIALTIRGIASDHSRLLGNLTITLPLARTAFGQRNDALDFVTFAPGATNAQVQPAVNRVLKAAFPQARSRTAAQFKQDQSSQINQLLALIYVLLALAIIVSLFGIVNTLVLSIYERTRELGMMRAIGTARRQVRAMIRWEGIITALIGAVIGLVIGIVFSIVITRPLTSEGFVLSIPVPTLILLLILAALAGWGASVLPARRAARLDILRALASE